MRYHCSFCGQETPGWRTIKTTEYCICNECLKMCSPLVRHQLTHPSEYDTLLTYEDIENDIGIFNGDPDEYANFKATQKIGRFIEFNDEKRQWLVPVDVLIYSNLGRPR